MKSLIKETLHSFAKDKYKTKVNQISEGSKRVKLDPRTESDINYLSQLIWTDSKTENDEEPKKGFIKVTDPKGSTVDVPVYYLSDFAAQGGVFPFDKLKQRNLYNLFIVVNPQEALVPSLKSTYHILYHEVQHLMDLNTTEYLSDKSEKKYSAEDKETGYWGHDFEFRAFSNEVMNGLSNEYKELFNIYSDDEIISSLDSLIGFFGKNQPIDRLGQKVLYAISSEESKGDYPYILKLIAKIRKFNPTKWNEFLKMLYSTVDEIKSELELNKQEMTESKFTKPRKYSKSYCEKTPCDDMGFSQKASCRAYKNCY